MSTPAGFAAGAAVSSPAGFSAGRLAQRCAIAVSLALLIGVVVSYVMLLHGGGAGPKKSDFVPYFSAGHLVGMGQGDAIYSFHRLGRFESSLVWPLQVKDGVMPYLYPPYFALILTPLAALPYVAGYLLWMVANVVLLLGSVAALQRYAGVRGGALVLFWAATLSFLPVLVGLAQGQTSIVLLALFSGVFLTLRADRQIPAGIFLACALVKPTYVLPVLALLALTRRWKAIAAFAVTALGLLAVPVAFLGTSINAGYGNTLLQASGWRTQIGGFEAQWNHSFGGFAQLLLPAPVSTVVTAALGLIALAAFLVAARRGQGFDRMFALTMVLGLLLSPHVLVHDLTLLVLPVAIALRTRPRFDRALPWVLGAGYAAVSAWLVVVAMIPLQLSVVAMCVLGAWLVLDASGGALAWTPGAVTGNFRSLHQDAKDAADGR